MKTRKNLVSILLLGALTATTALAYGDGFNQGRFGGSKMGQMSGQGMNSNRGFNNQSFHYNQGSKMGYKGNMKNNHRGNHCRAMGGPLFSMLNLTPEQAHEVRVLKTEMKLERLKSFDQNSRPMMNAWSESGFDKDKFISLSAVRSKQRVSMKANYMEKLYNILTPKQRELWINSMQINRGWR